LNYSYDYVGNIITLNDVTYQYDELDRLIHVQKGNNSTEYEYDPLGNRVEKIENTGGDPPQNWMDSSWTRRKPITITNNSGSTLTDYQIKLTVSYDSDMQSDFDDLRFTDLDGITQLSYWTESYTASSSATVWLKIPSLPISGKTIYMYYGNAAAADASNGDAVFNFFDDAEVGSPSDKWTVQTDLTVSYTTEEAHSGSKSMKITGPNDQTYWRKITAEFTAMENMAVHFMVKQTATDDRTFPLLHKDGSRVCTTRWNLDGHLYYYKDGTYQDTGVEYTTNWERHEWAAHNGEIKWKRDGEDIVDDITQNPWTDINRFIITHKCDSRMPTYYLDNVYIRKYTSTEPTVTFGAEEKIDGAGSTTDTVYYDYDIYNLTEERHSGTSEPSYIDEWVWEEGEYDPDLITIVHDEMDGISLNPERTANRIYKIDDVDSQAYEGESSSATGFADATTEFTSTDYGKIDGDDSNYVRDTAAATDKYQFHRFDTTIEENVDFITQIDFTVKGWGVWRKYTPPYLQTNYSYRLYVKENSTWAFKVKHNKSSKGTLTAQYTSNFGNIVQSGHIHWVVRTGKSTGGYKSQVTSYYGEIVVAYAPSEATYISAPKYIDTDVISFDGYESVAELNGQMIDLYFRSSGNGETWSDWYADIQEVPANQWIQFKAVLKTNDPSVSPILYNVTVIAITPTGPTTYTYSYDSNGNLISKTGPDTYAYTYNYNNMLTEVKKNGETIAQYFYDANGKRYKKIENNETIVYIWSGNNVVYEKNMTTNVETKYLYANMFRIAKIVDGVVTYYHQDHLLSTRLLTDANGNVIEEEEYEEFGSDINGINEKYKYTGKEKDITGLYYFGARYYDPTTGRFITRDPVKGSIMNPQTLNPYVYCLNNPMKYIDPDGRDHITPLLEDYVHDPLLSSVPIDTSTYRSTLLSIHRVQNRIYELRSKISEINLSGEYEEHKAKFKERQETTHRDIDISNWPLEQQEILTLGGPSYEGFLWAFGVYMLKFDVNMIRTDYHLYKTLRYQRYRKKYAELSEALEDLQEKLKSFDDKSKDNNGGHGRRDLIPI
jgi:RHS repeat-associated protein